MSQEEKYLFIRILEACNADCFMCGFAKSKDKYRFELEDLKLSMPQLYSENVRYVRFTGGEPLMHKQMTDMVQVLSDHDVKSSIITNGAMLAKKAPELAAAGLNQIIVSIDGLEKTHDHIRGTPGLFRKCIEGLKAAKDYNIMLRVNSVVGPQNYQDMPELQDILTDIGVAQWEMSSLKLGQKLDYSAEDRINIERNIILKIFSPEYNSGKLVPFGKIWCGDTAEERDRYFDTGITPRSDGVCHVVDRVRYLDARNGKLYACSLIPHRDESEKLFPAFMKNKSNMSVNDADILAQARYFKEMGPHVCTGCSTTAAGASNKISTNNQWGLWEY